MPSQNFNVCGLDIGYSNVKIASGGLSLIMPNLSVFPAYATTEKEEEVKLVKIDRADEEVVFLDGQEWRVFTNRPEPRELHDGYHKTSTYTALYYGALAKIHQITGSDIDLLVTGLPVSVASIESNRQELANRLTGTFEVRPGLTVTVKRVLVIPQGVGVINDIANRTNLISEEELSQSNILVIDPGFFSMDSVVFRNGNMVPASSGSSTNATSAIIDHVISHLRKNDPYSVSEDLPETIEIALREGKKEFFNGFKWISLEEAIEPILPHVTETVMKELRKSTRSISPIHVITGGGGGISFYQDSLKKTFPQARVVISPEPVGSNAIGFWCYGADVAQTEG